MDITTIILIGFVPAALVTLVGMLVLRAGPQGAGSRRLFIFMLAAGIMLLLAGIAAEQFTFALGPLSSYTVTLAMIPASTGALTVALTRVRALSGASWALKALAAVSALGLLAMIAVFGLHGFTWLHLITGGALLLAGLWALGLRSGALAVLLGLLALGRLALVNTNALDILNLPDVQVFPLNLLVIILGLFSPALVAASPAVLIAAAFKPAVPGQPAVRRRPWIAAGLRLALAAAVLGYLVYTLFWTAIWDQSTGGMGAAFLGTVAGMGGAALGMLMALRFSGWRRVLGPLFALLLLALIWAASVPLGVSYKTITAERAAGIQAAIQRYQARSGGYPAALADLAPGEMLWLPEPVLVRGESWCYQGGPDFYRLGAVYRDYVGGPFTVRVYASAGAPAVNWDCESRLALYPAWNGVTTPPPLIETPTPTSAVPIPPTVAVSFNLRDRSAWLPDGRLLFLSPAGDLLLLRPCQPGQENLTARYPQSFQVIAAPASKTGRVLLKSKSAFWILDSASLEAFPVNGATPNPFELHWDNYAWSPDGSRLAISRLNGETKKDGSTLYLVDAQNGAVLKILPLPGSSDQSAPMIEWENSHVLISSLGEASVLFDFDRANPLITTNVLKDLFGLDVTLNNVSTWAQVSPDGRSLAAAVEGAGLYFIPIK